MIKFTPLALVLFAAACAGPETSSTKDEHTHHHDNHGHARESAAFGQTMKPGAAVRFTHSLRDKVNPGGAGVLILEMEEIYEDGVMEITAVSSGLTLSAASGGRTIPLSVARNHQWDLFFDAPTAGRHYIDIVATVTEPSGAVSVRSYSAGVTVGDGAVSLKKSDAVEIDANGERIIVMEAVETTD